MKYFYIAFLACLFSSFSMSQTITNVSPNSGNKGSFSLPVVITGSGTNFSNATSTVVQIKQGTNTTIEILSVNSVSPTSIGLDIRISNLLPTGSYTVSVYDQTLGDMVNLPSGYTVLPSLQAPILQWTTPEKAANGQTLPVTISVDNANFSQATDNTIHLSQQGTSTLLFPVPGSTVVLNNTHIRAWFDFSNPSINSGSIFNSHCGNSFDGYFSDYGAITITDPTLIAGTVVYTGSFTGVVELYQKNTGVAPSTYSLVSTAAVSPVNGYQFTNLAQASYLIRSVPVGMTDVVATYYPSDISWQSATLLTTSSLLPSTGIDITPVTSLSLPGGVTVNGAIGYGPNGFNKASVDVVMAENVEVFLMNTLTSQYAQTTTDANGEFTFLGVPQGSYQIVIDLPGYLQTSTHSFTIDATTPNVNDLDFMINNSQIFTFGSLSIDDLEKPVLKVYPNPTNGEVHVQLPSTVTNVQVVIYNHVGQKMIEQTAKSDLFTMNTADLAPGLYIVRVQGEGYFAETKLIKR
jgi:hypothetical protein